MSKIWTIVVHLCALFAIATATALTIIGTETVEANPFTSMMCVVAAMILGSWGIHIVQWRAIWRALRQQDVVDTLLQDKADIFGNWNDEALFLTTVLRRQGKDNEALSKENRQLKNAIRHMAGQREVELRNGASFVKHHERCQRMAQATTADLRKEIRNLSEYQSLVLNMRKLVTWANKTQPR